MVSTGIHCYIFLRILFCVAISVAENDRMLNAKWCIWGFILYGYKKKKHRNRLIYGAFLLLLNVSLTVIKLFLAERAVPQLGERAPISVVKGEGAKFR